MGLERGTGDNDDAFEGLNLDESFIEAASIHERSADERIERLRRIDAEHRELNRQKDVERHTAARADHHRRRPPWVGIAIVVSVAAVLGLYTFAQTGDNLLSSSREGDHRADMFAFDGEEFSYPSVSKDRQDSPIGTPADPPAIPGPYRFVTIQPEGAAPVAYDPCRPVHVVVNDRTAPSNGDQLLQEALQEVSRATGLQFIVEGHTSETFSKKRLPTQPDRYGDRWAPILVAWSDPGESEELKGDVAGIGGSQAVGRGSDELVFVTGAIALDGPTFANAAVSTASHASARAVIEHELGHVVGLDHVNDPTELMNPTATPGVNAFGPGDLTGLNQLGKGRCFPTI